MYTIKHVWEGNQNNLRQIANKTTLSRAKAMDNRQAKPEQFDVTGGLFFCLVITCGGWAAAAATGGLRFADLVISAIVMVVIIAWAVRDSRWLPVWVVGTWIFVPCLRRIIDWQSGGYASVTALSLLPMIATSALLIPSYSRLRGMPRRLAEALSLISIPLIVASAIGIFLYGPGAVVEASQYLLPMLFVPYLATRQMTESEKAWQLRAMILMSAISALYGIYQFYSPPIWDIDWLIQSGMGTSMGKAAAQEMRIWGTLNAAGTAGVIWAIGLVSAFADRRWRPAWRYSAVTILSIALALTFVRIGWIAALFGIVTFAFLRGGRDSVTVVLMALFLATLFVITIPLIPGGDRVIDRAQTFSDLSNDGSVGGRVAVTAWVADQVVNRPWGAGLGYRTQSKVAGDSNNIEGVDNGYGEIFYAFGILGGILYLFGNFVLFTRIAGIRDDFRDGRPSELYIALARTMLITMAIFTCASASFLGIGGVWVWWCIGAAVAQPAASEILHLRGCRRNGLPR